MTRLAQPFIAHFPPNPEVVVAPTFESMDRHAQRTFAMAARDNFIHVVSPEARHPLDEVPDREVLLAEGAASLARLVEDGILTSTPREVYGVLRLREHGLEQVGIVAAIPVAAYLDGRVKPHEQVRLERAELLTAHLEAVRVSGQPVALIHRAEPQVESLLRTFTSRQPTAEVGADHGPEQSLWIVEDPVEIAAVMSALALIEALYVADGHHRLAAAASYATRPEAGPNAHRFLAMVMSEEHCSLQAYHRLVTGVDAVETQPLLGAMAEEFEITELGHAKSLVPTSTGTFGLSLAGRRFRLVLRNPTGALDVQVLQDKILGPIFSVSDPQSDPRLSFVPGTVPGRLEVPGGAGFALHPTSVSQLMAVADSGGVMPPKSTWFTPKPRAGMIVKMLG